MVTLHRLWKPDKQYRKPLTERRTAIKKKPWEQMHIWLITLVLRGISATSPPPQLQQKKWLSGECNIQCNSKWIMWKSFTLLDLCTNSLCRAWKEMHLCCSFKFWMINLSKKGNNKILTNVSFLLQICPLYLFSNYFFLPLWIFQCNQCLIRHAFWFSLLSLFPLLSSFSSLYVLT